ncbi:MAG: hypothetical protein WDM77_21975 [Steroidobacteraceae bacterium]
MPSGLFAQSLGGGGGNGGFSVTGSVNASGASAGLSIGGAGNGGGDAKAVNVGKHRRGHRDLGDRSFGTGRAKRRWWRRRWADSAWRAVLGAGSSANLSLGGTGAHGGTGGVVTVNSTTSDCH